MAAAFELLCRTASLSANVNNVLAITTASYKILVSKQVVLYLVKLRCTMQTSTDH